jgi:O-antigen/teichoic acid export membrane protein
MFAALGIPVYGLREIARYNHDPEGRQKVFSELFLINCLGAIVFSGIYLVTIYSVPALYRELEFLLITGISVVFVPLNVDWFFSGREKFKLVTIRTLAAKVIALAGLFIFVRNRDDIVPYLLLTVTANLSSQVWNFGYMWKTEVKFRIKNLDIKKHIRSVLILLTSKISVSIYTMLNVVMLGFMSDYKEVGYYTSAMKVSTIAIPILTAMSPVIMARINTIKDCPGQVSGLLSRSFEYILILSLPVAIGLILVSSRFVPLFFGAEFIPAIKSMQLLSLLVVIIGLSNFFGSQILISMGHENKFLTAILFGSISSFILNLILIKPYGSLGASIASVIAESLVTFMLYLFASKIAYIHIKFKNIYQPLLSAITIIPVSLYYDSVIDNDLAYLLATILTGGVVYAISMIYIFRNKQTIQIVNTILKRIKR